MQVMKSPSFWATIEVIRLVLAVNHWPRLVRFVSIDFQDFKDLKVYKGAPITVSHIA